MDEADGKAGPIRLRGHHFLCLLTYKGLGYTDRFVENMTEIAARIDAGEQVVLHEGPDAICAALSPEDRAACNHDCGKPETLTLDRLAEDATRAVLGHGLDAAFPLTAEKVARLRAAFAAGETRAACEECRWKAVCDGIVGEGFAGVVMGGDAAGTRCAS